MGFFLLGEILQQAAEKKNSRAKKRVFMRELVVGIYLIVLF